MKDFLLREYKPEDFDEIYNLWLELDLTSPQRGDTKESIEETLRLGGKFWVIEHQNKVIATCWVTNDGRRLYLHHFGIKKQYQGQRLSYLLISEALKYSKFLNRQIKLEVHKDNIVAINFYKKVGFSYLGDYLVFIIREPQKINLD